MNANGTSSGVMTGISRAVDTFRGSAVKIPSTSFHTISYRQPAADEVRYSKTNLEVHLHPIPPQAVLHIDLCTLFQQKPTDSLGRHRNSLSSQSAALPQPSANNKYAPTCDHRDTISTLGYPVRNTFGQHGIEILIESLPRCGRGGVSVDVFKVHIFRINTLRSFSAMASQAENPLTRSLNKAVMNRQLSFSPVPITASCVFGLISSSVCNHHQPWSSSPHAEPSSPVQPKAALLASRTPFGYRAPAPPRSPMLSGAPSRL